MLAFQHLAARRLAVAAFAAACAWPALAAPPDAPGVCDRRARDWRNGAVVYQVIVDRFVPTADLEAKRSAATT